MDTKENVVNVNDDVRAVQESEEDTQEAEQETLRDASGKVNISFKIIQKIIQKENLLDIK